MRAEADRVSAISFRWDVRPRSALSHKLSDCIRVVGSVGEQHSVVTEFCQQIAGEWTVMILTGAKRQPDRQSLRVPYRVDLRCQSTARAACAVAFAFLGTASVLMHPDNGRVEHLDIGVTTIRRGREDVVPDARLAPSIEVFVAGRLRAVAFGQIAPSCP